MISPFEQGGGEKEHGQLWLGALVKLAEKATNALPGPRIAKPDLLLKHVLELVFQKQA